jgi:hypothetical protein
VKLALAGAHAAALLTLAAIARGADDDDARRLFAGGDYRAAAAAFEARWEASHDPHDGLNAVIALRSAGAYAHGLALLDRVRGAGSLPPDVGSRVKLLDTTLHELTGTIALEKLPPEATLEVDGGPAWRSGGEIVVNVGRRELSIARPGCDPFRWTGTVRPGQRVAVAVSLVCHEVAGSIHVNLSGAAGAHIRIDGQPFVTSTYDFDVPEPPGLHHVDITRRGILLSEETVTVAPAKSATVHAVAPWRAKGSGLILGATAQGIVATNGPTGSTGVVFGYQNGSFSGGIDPGAAIELIVMFGAATTGVGEGAAPRLWLGMTAGISNLLPALWQRKTGATTWVLDFEPTLATFQVAPTSEPSFIPGVDATANVTYLGLLPVVLTADLPFAHAELAVFPAGVLVHKGFALLDERRAQVTHAASLALTVGWKVLGD